MLPRSSRSRARLAAKVGALLTGASALLAMACGAPAAEAPPRAAIELHQGPLASYLPSPGLRWALQLRPRSLLENQLVREELDRLLPPARLDAFAASSGVEVSALEEAWFAEYELGDLVLTSEGEATRGAAARFEARALSLTRRKTPTPELTHFTGIVQREPSAFVQLSGSFVAWATRDPSLAKMVRGYAEKKIRSVPPALDGLLLAPLSSLAPDAPLRLFGVGPFEGDDPFSSGALSAGLAARFEGEELVVHARILGAWEASPDVLGAELGERFAELLERPELRALGAGSQSRPLESTCARWTDPDPRLDGLIRCEGTTAFSAREVLRRGVLVLVGSLPEIGAP